MQGQGTALSKTELLTAYQLLDDLRAAGIKQLSSTIKDNERVVCDTQKDATIRAAGDIIVKESNEYNALVTRYNALVDEYKGLLSDYRSYATDEVNAWTRMAGLVNLTSSYNWSPPSPPQVIYTAPTPTQIRCTTQNMPPAVPGLSSWSYMTCY